MAFLERLRAFAGKSLAEEGVAKGQRHHKEGDLPLLAAINDCCLAEIGLRLARSVRQRHEDLGRPLLDATDLFPNDRDAAGVALLLQPLENPFRRVPLFLGSLLVCFENL
jgi:hypothetical protein